MSDDLRTRLVGGFAALLFVIVAGTIGYYLLGEGRWSMADCFYMTAITLTTVGFGEVLPDFEQVEHVRTLTVILLVFGMGTFLYFASTLTAVIIEGDLRAVLRKTRMRKQISQLEDHFIVCGVGSTGGHIIEELLAVNRPVVAIDTSAERLEALAGIYDKHFMYVVGDATEDEILESANLTQARGLVAALASDKDNLYLVVSARQANASARIVARGSDIPVLAKLKKAGADTVVSPNYIGGMRMVSEMIRPNVVRFLDVMLRDANATMRIDEVTVGVESRYAGHKLKDADIRRDLHVTVLAALEPGSEDYIYNPDGEFMLTAGMTMVVLGDQLAVDKLRKAAA